VSANRGEIVAFCDELLSAGEFDDYGPNGLQVPGAAEVSKVATGVSANLETLRGGVEAGAQMTITHHGLFWEFLPRALSPQMTERLRVLLDGDVSLAAYHLPLDAHPEVGNNALLCGLLGFEVAERFGEARGASIGFVGRSEAGIPLEELTAAIERELGRAPLVQGRGPERISSIGVVTGAGAGAVHEAVAAGLDALITGEPAEHVMADAEEGGLHFIAAGHYATETLGIRRLGDLVAERFGVEHEFIDVPNPV
jgi:dinuclear metal center YbgI/SA1388 family protein